MANFSILVCLLLMMTVTESRWRPCIEIKRELRLPCKCAIDISSLTKSSTGLEINCDRMTLSDDVLSTLTSQPITSFSQQYCGYQNLPTQLINFLPPTVESLDLSGNQIHRLMDRQFRGRNNIKELRLANNALGDSLNPIFSSNEFNEITDLRLLDLRYNALRSIEEGIFKGCPNLEELYLDFNNITTPPMNSLKGPKAIKVLSLAGNIIGSIERSAFSVFGKSLLRLDLSSNGMTHLEDGAFIGMTSLLVLNISYNAFHHINSDVFKGVNKLQELDLSTNFLEEFPTAALRNQKNLTFLNISNNLITEVQHINFVDLKDLHVLDLSRNGIGRLGINAFTALTSLVQLDLSFNALRAVEETSFEGLKNLEWLSLQDNNILLVPSAALARLPSLAHLRIEFNRIAALSNEILRNSASHIISISLSRNLVRELPPRLFFNFDKLLSIDLSGNMIPIINEQNFVGIEDTLLYLDLSYNCLNALNEIPLRNLISLNLAGNNLKKVSPETFKHLNRLQFLNISNNPLYGGFPPIFPRSLISLDVTCTGLEILPSVLLLNLENLESISISRNKLKELTEGTFRNLFNLTYIDLSNNEITKIENPAFVGLHNLYNLNLRGNKLKFFGGESFNTGTGLELLDLSENLLQDLSPTSFLIHPRLRKISLSGNQLTGFSSEVIKTLQFLEFLDLSNNKLTIIEEFVFAQIARLRELNLSNNSIGSVGELAFHNSTQLQWLDLSRNVLENLNERMMEGLLRVEKLNLMDNRLLSLPDTIFDTSRIRSLEKLDLSKNRFLEIPTKSLKKQAANLVYLNIARNHLSEIFSQDVINSVKDLDLSENALSDSTIHNIFTEAKVLRSLKIESCNIRKIEKLEAPYLRYLNLANNNLELIEPLALERTTMLEELNVSKNELKSFDTILSAFGSLTSLKIFDISENDIKIINQNSLSGFENLEILKISRLLNCSRLEKNAFKNLLKLRNLQIFDFPKLGYFDSQGIIKGMNNLEILDIEIKDLNVGNEQLSVIMHPRLKALTLRGERLRNVLSSLLVGIRAPRLSIELANTSIDTIPATLFFPVPRSTLIELDVSGSKLKTISPQLISAFEERTHTIKLKGLKIGVKCDCEVRHLWKLCKSLTCETENSITCIGPESLSGKSLSVLTEEQLFCQSEESTSLFQLEDEESTTTGIRHSTNLEPEIIWTVAPTMQDSSNIKNVHGESTMNVSIGLTTGTDDTLIIGIVGGVITFIAIIIIIICICRLRWSNQVNESHMQAAMASSIHEPSMLRPGSTYSGKLNQDLYVSTYNGSTMGPTNNGTSVIATPMHMLPFVQPLPMIHTSTGTQQIYGYCDNSSLPIYITTCSENKYDR